MKENLDQEVGPYRKNGAPGAIPTRDLPLRRRTLYATELREPTSTVNSIQQTADSKKASSNYYPSHKCLSKFQGHSTGHSFPRGRTHREVSFRCRRCSLSFIISLMSATGRSSTGPSPYLKPGSCETS